MFLGFMFFRVQVFLEPTFSGSGFFRVQIQVFQGPDPGIRAQVLEIATLYV